MLSEKRKFGDIGENLAADFLKQKGYAVLDKNYRLRGGELDIVAAKFRGLLNSKIEEIIFVEVKTIESSGSQRDLALAGQNVHFGKQRRLIRAAKIYLAVEKIPPEIPWRIDVVVVALNSRTHQAKIEHLENAVWGR